MGVLKSTMREHGPSGHEELAKNISGEIHSTFLGRCCTGMLSSARYQNPDNDNEAVSFRCRVSPDGWKGALVSRKLSMSSASTPEQE